MTGAATLSAISRGLASGARSSVELVAQCIAAIEREGGQGRSAIREFNASASLRAARDVDMLRKAGARLGPLAGIPISIKDLFDVEGETTLAGSTVLAARPPARRDAQAVGRLRAGGMILLGRANMSEFAYSGLGLNPHYGTPLSPWQRSTGRVAGGSSSGSAVSVSDHMAHAALGSDTGGSCRIPAAFCGLVGFKPTRDPALMLGAIPLAPSLDTAGVLARSVECCAMLWKILQPRAPRASHPRAGKPVLGVLHTLVLDGLDQSVSVAFERALARLGRHFSLRDVLIPVLGSVPAMNAKGGLPAAESCAWHRDLLAASHARYDPLVRARILRGKEIAAHEHAEILARREAIIGDVAQALASCDALVMPTVAMVPPALHELNDAARHHEINALALRNSSLVNLFDGCAVSVPVHVAGEAPVGLSIACGRGQDHKLLCLAACVEQVLCRT